MDAAELLLGHSDLLERSLFQAERVDLRPSRGRGNDKSAEQRRSKHPAFHFTEPPLSRVANVDRFSEAYRAAARTQRPGGLALPVRGRDTACLFVCLPKDVNLITVSLASKRRQALRADEQMM